MRSRKGFTLVELLAVIAILAILVIIALPNVINMYNRAQKQTFLTEAKKVYSESEKKYLSNAISGKKTKVINSEDSSKLDMTGKKLQYCVVLNNNGKVTDMKVSNGKWVASLKGKTIDDLTIDDLEDGNLDDYECGEPATDESCFTYAIAGSEDGVGTPAITIQDATKCKNYLISDGAPEDIATTLCAGGLYNVDNGAYTIQDIALDEISKDDYVSSGLNLKYLMIEKVEVVDTTKCKNYFVSRGTIEENAIKVCSTGMVDGYSLQQVVVAGLLPYINYELSGLKVTSKVLTTEVSITGYDTGCGTDVIIPSKIKGNTVVGISSFAFNASCLRDVKSNVADDYKIRFLDYSSDEKYTIDKVDIEIKNCISDRLTSVVIPKSIYAIGNYAFAYNSLSDVTIPSSVKYIGSYSFRSNNIKTVTYNGNRYDISFGDCPYGRNSDYPERNMYCKK